jgi:DNA-directed RNA polymerase specialized sigma24 family protein
LAGPGSFLRHLFQSYALHPGRFRTAPQIQKAWGGKVKKVVLDQELLSAPEPGADIERLDDALNALSAFDLRKAKAVEMRYFGGLSVEETAGVLKVSPDTVKRDWRLAKVWLLNEMLSRRENET